MKKTAYFAGGCFWGLEDLFRKQKGVLEITAGYCGGTNDNPTYQNHPGHAETIKIIYDNTQTNFWELLDFFFQIHNPTTLNQQGNDMGTSYRSAIFYQNEEEKKQSQDFIKIVNESKRWPTPVVTTLEPYTKFYDAEEYHQDYLQKNPNGYTCHRIYFDSYLKNRNQQYTEEALKKILNEQEFHVLREGGTEMAFSGKTIKPGVDGKYHCKVCNSALFSQESKFESGTGWPSFDKALPNAVTEKTDTSHGMIRTEINCSKCGSHLGHVFEDGPTETGKRYCTNSVCFA